MISRKINPGTIVWHAILGFGNGLCDNCKEDLDYEQGDFDPDLTEQTI